MGTIPSMFIQIQTDGTASTWCEMDGRMFAYEKQIPIKHSEAVEVKKKSMYEPLKIRGVSFERHKGASRISCVKFLEHD